MKVIQILPELNAGGVERGTLEIARHLVLRSHESLVVSNGGRLVAQLEDEGSRHIAMPVHRKSLASLAQILPMRRLLERERPDVIHIRSRVPGWITWLAWRGMDPQSRPRLVSTVHGFYSVNVYSSVMTKGERVIAVSNCIQAYIEENYPKTPHDSIRVIPRGIVLGGYSQQTKPDTAWLDTWTTQNPRLDGKVILLLPGRITRLKGHEDFFRLVAALKKQGHPVHGLIAGDTHPKKRAYLDELKAHVDGFGLTEDITFLGHRTDIREVMCISQIVCALSQQPESFGRTVLEALALGKPVVGYDCGGVGELLAEFFPLGKIPPGDVSGLVEATATIIRGCPVPGSVGEPFTIDCMCQATEAVYQEVLSAWSGGLKPP
jgi:glycosyltransferase involved in cell wall biosynthesis